MPALKNSRRFILFLLCFFIVSNFLLVFAHYQSLKNIDAMVSTNNAYLQEFNIFNQLQILETSAPALNKQNNLTALANFKTQLTTIRQNVSTLQPNIENNKTIALIDTLQNFVQQIYSLKNNAFLNNNTAYILEDILQIEKSRSAQLSKLSTSIGTAGKQAEKYYTILLIIAIVLNSILFWYIINTILKQKQFIQQIKESRKKIEEVSLQRENFMAVMSHEIRTPMNAIIGFSNLLSKQKSDPLSFNYIKTIQDAGEKLLYIVNDILDVSKIDAGMMRLENIMFEPKNVIEKAFALFTVNANSKNVKYSLEYDNNIPLVLEGDPARLSQILINVLANAFKFTTAGCIDVKVICENKNAINTTITFFITDTGIGMSEKYIATYF